MASGGRDAERVKLKLEIKVEEVWNSNFLTLAWQNECKNQWSCENCYKDSMSSMV